MKSVNPNADSNDSKGSLWTIKQKGYCFCKTQDHSYVPDLQLNEQLVIGGHQGHP